MKAPWESAGAVGKFCIIISYQYSGSWRVSRHTHYLQAQKYGWQEYHLDFSERRRERVALQILNRIAEKRLYNAPRSGAPSGLDPRTRG